MSPSEYQQLVAFLGERFTAIDQRFESMDQQIRELRAEMLGHFDELYRRLERIEQEYLAVTSALCRNVLLADVPAIVGSIDIVMGEVDR